MDNLDQGMAGGADNTEPQGQADMSGADMSGGYVIEITVGSNNQVQSVNVEAAKTESTENMSGVGMAEQPGSEQAEPAGTQVSTISDALQIARDIYNNSGQINGNDRASIAKQVFGEAATRQAMPGQLARKPNMRGGY